MKFFYVVLLVLIQGCGPLDESSSILMADGDTSIVVQLSKNYGTQRILSVSSKGDVDEVELCKVNDLGCEAIANLEFLGKKNDRKIYSTAKFPLDAIGSYQIKATNQAFDVEVRRFSITPANDEGQAGVASNWKSVYLAGDYVDNGLPVTVWDNARLEISKLLNRRGFSAKNSVHLSRDPKYIKEDVKQASIEGLNSAFEKLNPTKEDSCFLFMTSHGTRSSFFIEGGSPISPTDFDRVLVQHCGERPTVALVSACYSGIMINDQTKKDNRIIFTASSPDRTSNGCAPGITYTFFDDCIIKGLNKDSVKTYDQLATDIKSCIDNKETAANASFPQFFIGDKMKNLKIGATLNDGNDPIDDDLDAIIDQDEDPAQDDGVETTNNIGGAKNLALRGANGAVDLKSIAGKAKYLLIDFSAPTCSYCLQFAGMLEQNSQYFKSETCKAVTLVNPNQRNGWVSRLTSRGLASAGDHAYELTSGSHGRALGALEDSGNPGSVPTPTILLFDTAANKVISKNVGALQKSELQNFLGSKCGE